MKKLITFLLYLLLAGLCACRQATPEPPESSATSMTSSSGTVTEATSISTIASSTRGISNEDTPYSDFLRKYIKERDGKVEHSYYTFHDIDGDGTEELLMGWAKDLERVYTIHNGIVVRQEPGLGGDYNPPVVLFNNGAIRSIINLDGPELQLFNYYRIEDGNLKLQIQLRAQPDYYKHYKNEEDTSGILITKAEFDRLQKELEGDGQEVELDWKPLAEFER